MHPMRRLITITEGRTDFRSDPETENPIAKLLQTLQHGPLRPGTTPFGLRHFLALAAKGWATVDGGIRDRNSVWSITDAGAQALAAHEGVLKEDGLVVQGVNTTVDVAPGEISRQAAKFGNQTDANGLPPLVYEDDEMKGGKKSPLSNKMRREKKAPAQNQLWFKELFSKKK